MREPHERLKWARERRNVGDATAAARRFGWNENTYRSHENGTRDLSRKAAENYAKAFRVTSGWLLYGEGNPEAAPVFVRPEGYIGAGAEVIPVDSDGGGLSEGDEVELPPGAPPDTKPVIVRGESMYPRYFDGEKLFYVKEDRPPEELIGRECVVRLADGRTLVKILRRGSRRKVYNLESWNAPLMEDQKVEWAAPVRWRG